MPCFNTYRSEFVVKVLAVLQFIMKGSNIALAMLTIAAAWKDRNATSSSNTDCHCECVLKQRPASCQLIQDDPSDAAIALWDPLLVICSMWIGLLNFLMFFRDLRFRTSRIMNSLVFLLSGSIYIGMGNHYERNELSIVGDIACILSLVLLFSVPVCGRVKPFDRDERSSGLLDNDEFAQANGVFSSLND